LSLDAPALDTAALEAWLAEAAQAERVEIREAAPLSGGAIQENWRLDAVFHGGPSEGRRELVLRTDAASSVATSHSRPQEFALLQAAAGAGVTVPEPLWCCADRAVLGRAFYVMARAPGVALGPKVVKDESLGGDREPSGSGASWRASTRSARRARTWPSCRCRREPRPSGRRSPTSRSTGAISTPWASRARPWNGVSPGPSARRRGPPSWCCCTGTSAPATTWSTRPA
jgi:hypothetical protein